MLNVKGKVAKKFYDYFEIKRWSLRYPTSNAYKKFHISISNLQSFNGGV
jgi:hypothetical protein